MGKIFQKENCQHLWEQKVENHRRCKICGLNQLFGEIPIKAGSPKGGIVMDIFSGSGTTCLVAKKLGRNYIGIDLNPKYCKIAEARLKAVPKSLF